MTTLSDVLEHQDACSACTADEPCATAEELFAAARDAISARFEPPRTLPFELIDFDGHKQACANCTDARTCAAGRLILDEAARAIDKGVPIAAKRMVRA